ncbi:MAG: enoyl-CoA hydratase/isomerase family protein [Caulobacteraceae bacterium]|nr:enoyl-CoA hydratase/isomerase family protein [Caulobacteraceae bacterium]
MYEHYTALGVEQRGGELRITLQNPPLNGMTPQMHDELPLIFRQVARDPQARVVVLTGSGDRAFSAGGDIRGMYEGLDRHEGWVSNMPGSRDIILSILECDKPVIARINGHAMGLGASIALACDITVMLDTARIADTHVKVGLVAGDGGSLIWPHLIGLQRAKRYLLTGDALTGAQAAEIGLVTEAASAADLDRVVDAWAERLGNGATRAISLTKRALNSAIRQQGQIFMDLHLGLETWTHLSQDHREAATAFLEKREPKFTGE